MPNIIIRKTETIGAITYKQFYVAQDPSVFPSGRFNFVMQKIEAEDIAYIKGNGDLAAMGAQWTGKAGLTYGYPDLSEFEIDSLTSLTSGGGGGDASSAKQDEQTALLTSISNEDFSTATKQDLAKTVLDNILAKILTAPATEAKQNLEVWDTIVGNSTAYTYYTGVEAGNPSGSVDNIKTIAYKTGASTIITQTLTYNSTDSILTITAS